MRHAFAICLTALTVITPAIAWAEEAQGDWVGRMDSGFTFILHIAKSATGYTAELRTPNGNVTKLERITSNGVHLSFSTANGDLSYDGDWNATNRTWTGTLTFGQAYPVSFRRAEAADLAPPVRRRPQEDAIAAGPLPYAQSDVVIPNAKAPGVALAGTFSVPAGKGPFPAVVLVSGTGYNSRDEEVDGHKVFLVLADALNRAGVAVLRYDKRGVGASTGMLDGATTADLATDADAALNWLAARPEVNRRKVGIIGHSEGGVIAPMVAVTNTSAAFVVTIAGPGLRGDKLFALQRERISTAQGVPADYIAQRKAFDEKLTAAATSGPDPAESAKRVRAVIDQGLKDKVITETESNGLMTPWMRYFLSYDPCDALRRLKTPILVLNGSLDMQVPAAENLAVIRPALKDNSQATIMELPGLNHLLQTARTGSPDEYGAIDETISPAALEIITRWVTAR